MIDNFALIIGSAKSGTSSLFSYLAEHPEIASCSKKETQFFAEPKVFERGFTYYQNLWDWDSKKHQVALEATPNYSRITHQNLLNAASKIAEVRNTQQVKFKFIYLMRSPISRIESHYTHLEAWGQEANVRPYGEGLANEIIDISKYAMQLDEYYQRFPAKDILLLNFEDLKQDPASLLCKVCQFLTIDADYQFKTLNTVYNSNKLRKKVFLPGWRNLRQTYIIKAIARATPSSARETFKNLFGQKVTRQIKLTPDETKYVLNYLHDDLQRLCQEYQVNTSRWNLPQLVSSSNQVKE
jgi:Sulfotransferase domain